MATQALTQSLLGMSLTVVKVTEALSSSSQLEVSSDSVTFVTYISRLYCSIFKHEPLWNIDKKNRQNHLLEPAAQKSITPETSL